MFAFRLCKELGVIHPDYLLPMLTAEQIGEWMAYFILVDRKQKRGKGKQTISDQKETLQSIIAKTGGKIIKRKK